jgi:hypothetical protein
MCSNITSFSFKCLIHEFSHEHKETIDAYAPIGIALLYTCLHYGYLLVVYMRRDWANYKCNDVRFIYIVATCITPHILKIWYCVLYDYDMMWIGLFGIVEIPCAHIIATIATNRLNKNNKKHEENIPLITMGLHMWLIVIISTLLAAALMLLLLLLTFIDFIIYTLSNGVYTMMVLSSILPVVVLTFVMCC